MAPQWHFGWSYPNALSCGAMNCNGQWWSCLNYSVFDRFFKISASKLVVLVFSYAVNGSISVLKCIHPASVLPVDGFSLLRQHARTSVVLWSVWVQLFRDDVQYLLTMASLWKKRRAPMPLSAASAQQQCAQDDGTWASDTFKAVHFVFSVSLWVKDNTDR